MKQNATEEPTPDSGKESPADNDQNQNPPADDSSTPPDTSSPLKNIVLTLLGAGVLIFAVMMLIRLRPPQETEENIPEPDLSQTVLPEGVDQEQELSDPIPSTVSSDSEEVPPDERFMGLDRNVVANLNLAQWNGVLAVEVKGVNIRKRQIGNFRTGALNEAVFSDVRIILAEEALTNHSSAKTQRVGEEELPFSDSLMRLLSDLPTLASARKERVSRIIIEPFSLAVRRGDGKEISMLTCDRLVTRQGSRGPLLDLIGKTCFTDLQGTRIECAQAHIQTAKPWTVTAQSATLTTGTRAREGLKLQFPLARLFSQTGLLSHVPGNPTQP